MTTLQEGVTVPSMDETKIEPVTPEEVAEEKVYRIAHRKEAYR